IDKLNKYHPAIVFAQIDLPPTDGYTLLDASIMYNPSIPVVLVTEEATVEEAIETLKSGAFDYMQLPLQDDKIRHTLMSINQSFILKEKGSNNGRLERGPIMLLEGVIGQSESMQAVMKRVLRVAKNSVNVFISGESGTGKELIAKSIHHYSDRSNKPFIPVDCVALPSTLLESELFGYEKGAFTGALNSKPGLIELAHGGTLFLDEITELDLYMQAKLLRVIQERQFRRIGGKSLIKVDIRIISATNWDPKRAVEQKQLRKDLFYRLHVVPIHVPALRERKSDIPILAKHFLKTMNRRYRTTPISFAEKSLQMLKRSSWPGNVRELQNVVEQMASLIDKDQIDVEDLPENVRENPAFEKRHYNNMSFKAAKERYMKKFCRNYFQTLLKKHDGNISKIAREARLSRGTIYKLLEETNLDR
ncbi:AAA domain-containing protein, partial [candidate division KSB1 bacterium]|nr:AAA domain-containing protein [candidate division KSB1 bacterium]